MLLSEEKVQVVHLDNGTEIPYKIHSVGIYLVIEAKNNVILLWDKKTSLMIRLGPSFKASKKYQYHSNYCAVIQWIVYKCNYLLNYINIIIFKLPSLLPFTRWQGKVCGLCGNYDGNSNNDFLTRRGEEVVEPLEFGNSWSVSSTCPKTSSILSPCDIKPHRQAYAIKQCSIIKSDVFSSCLSLVSYYFLNERA